MLTSPALLCTFANYFGTLTLWFPHQRLSTSLHLRATLSHTHTHTKECVCLCYHLKLIAEDEEGFVGLISPLPAHLHLSAFPPTAQLMVVEVGFVWKISIINNQLLT